jgi:hypothetical protein
VFVMDGIFILFEYLPPRWMVNYQHHKSSCRKYEPGYSVVSGSDSDILCLCHVSWQNSILEIGAVFIIN